MLFNRTGAAELREHVIENQDEKITIDILQHFNELHALDLPVDHDIDREILQDELLAINQGKAGVSFGKGLVTFSPSSASKCQRELFYKASRVGKDQTAFHPYQRRWMRNGSAVHAAVQKDLLYAEKYVRNPKFLVERTPDGRPAWEKNIRKVKKFIHNKTNFQIHGMMDGILLYQPTATRLGFEFKTKSTTISAVGTYKMKGPQASHLEQCTAYSLLFDLDEFLIVYESLAKDSWMKGEEAKPDMRAFHVTVTDADREALLDKFAAVATDFYGCQMPDVDMGKCIFCTYKSTCDLSAKAV